MNCEFFIVLLKSHLPEALPLETPCIYLPCYCTVCSPHWALTG